MTDKIVLIDYQKLSYGENPRLPAKVFVEELALDIAANGLKTPVLLLEIKKDKDYRILQGNRRGLAIRWLFENNPVCAKGLFDKGVPAIVKKGLNQKEVVNLIIDHGQIKGLTDPMELQMAANMLFAADNTEREVVVSLATLLETHNPMKPAHRSEWLDLTTRCRTAREAGQHEWALNLQNDAEKFLFTNRRGKVQNLHNAYRAPAVIMQALWLKATGDFHVNTSKDLQKTMPLQITYAQITKLYKVFAKEIEDFPEAQITKEQPGPLFWAAWDSNCEAAQEAAAEKAAGKNRQKAMSAKDMMLDVSQAEWSSEGFRALTRFHAGESEDVDKTTIKAMDKVCKYAEVIAESDPDLWESVVKTAEGIINEQIAAQREIAAKAAVTK